MVKTAERKTGTASVCTNTFSKVEGYLFVYLFIYLYKRRKERVMKVIMIGKYQRTLKWVLFSFIHLRQAGSTEQSGLRVAESKRKAR